MPKMSKAAKRVDIKRKKFITEYVKNGNLTDAMATAYPKMKRTSAASHASQLIKRPDIQNEIKLEMKKAGISLSDLMNRKKSVVVQGGEQLEKQRVSPELYNKTLDGLIDLYNTSRRESINTSLNINIDTATTPQLLKKRGEFNSFFDSIIEGEIIDDTASEKR